MENTPLDFTTWQPIGARIEKISGGYDHNYVLNRKWPELTLAASVREPRSGRVMTVHTTSLGCSSIPETPWMGA